MDGIDYQFTWLKEGETVRFIKRGFLPIVIFQMCAIIFFFSIPAIVVEVITTDLWQLRPYREVLDSGLLVWISLGLLWSIYILYEWLFDVVVVTSHRIVDIDQQGLFHKTITDAGLDKVQDIVYEEKGLLQTFFNFGNVIIYTAGKSGGFAFEHVYKPRIVQERLSKIIKEFKDAQESPLTARELLQFLKQASKEEIPS
jgi:hypothetical protein